MSEPSEPPQVVDPDGAALPGEQAELVRRVGQLIFDQAGMDGRLTHWMGVLVNKLPPDLIALQEVVFETRPDLIVESGVSVGGSTLFFANVLDLLGAGEVIGIDVDLSRVDERVREHPRITLIEGSSTDPDLVATVRQRAGEGRVMVDLDSDHSGAHVLEELRQWAPLVAPGCYLVVEDTVYGSEVLADEAPGPAQAVAEWLAADQPFEVDRGREKFLLTSNRGGFLRRLGAEPVAEPSRLPEQLRAERESRPVIPPMPEVGDVEAMQDWLRAVLWSLQEKAVEVERLRAELDRRGG